MELQTDKNQQVEQQKQTIKVELQKLVVLANGESIFSLQSTYKDLLTNHFVYSKMIGLNSSSKNLVDFTAEPYLIDKYSTTYLIDNNIYQVNKDLSNAEGLQQITKIKQTINFKAYSYFKKQKEMSLYLLDGHKFGGEFLAYQQNPDSNHATYLVFVSKEDEPYKIDHISRLAGICKKTALMLHFIQKQNDVFEIKEEQIIPRVQENKKVNGVSSNCTKEVLKLKRMLGYNV